MLLTYNFGNLKVVFLMKRIEFIYSVFGLFLFTAKSVSFCLWSPSYQLLWWKHWKRRSGCPWENPWQEGKAIGEHCHCVTKGLFEVVRETCLLQSPTVSLTNGCRAFLWVERNGWEQGAWGQTWPQVPASVSWDPEEGKSEPSQLLQGWWWSAP